MPSATGRLGRAARPRATGFRRVLRIVRVVLLALLVAFLVGFVIGTLIRRQLEEPVHYYGHHGRVASTRPAGAAA